MKILFLNDFIPPRNNFGPGKRDFELAKEFVKNGNEIYFITSCQDRKFEGEEIIDGIKIFNIYSKYNYRFKFYVSTYNFFAVRKAGKILKNLKPDIVHADIIQFHLSFAVLKVAKKYAKAVFFTARDFTLFSSGKFLQKEKECGKINYKVSWFDDFKKAKIRFNPLRNFITKKYLKYVDKIFTVSSELGEALKQNSIINTDVVYNGIAVSENNAVDFDEIGFNKIFLLGRINESKGVYALLDSFPIVLSKVSDVEIIISGAREEEKLKIERYIKKMGIKKNKIKIFNYLDGEELNIAYKTSSIVVSPSLYPDPFPGVNLEAALYGKPVITTCFGGAREFIINGETGYVINPFNKEEMAQKIIELLTNKEKIKNFGRANFERLKNNFTIKKQAEILLNWYKKYEN